MVTSYSSLNTATKLDTAYEDAVWGAIEPDLVLLPSLKAFRHLLNHFNPEMTPEEIEDTIVSLWPRYQPQPSYENYGEGEW